MPAPISSASPNGPPARRRAPWRASRGPGPGRRAEVDPPLGVVLGRRGVVVAGVGVLDLVGGRGRGGGHRRGYRVGDESRSRLDAASRSSENQPAGRAAAGADRRADAARRPGGELLVPAPPRRLRVDRRAGARACGSPTSPAARATARTCSPRPRPRWSGSTPTPRPTSTPGCATGGPNLRFERALVESFAEPLRRDRLPADDRAHRGPGRAAGALRRARRRSPTSRPRTG